MQIISNVSVTNSSFFKYSEKVQKNACSGYELSNHLGNVLAVITDRRIQTCGMGDVMHYEAQVVSISDYYPFGMGIKDREWKDSTFSYRFGFNGKEKDDEVNGDGNNIAFEARIYDTRLSRFIAQDPMSMRFPSWSPYMYAANSPISLIDEFGYRPRVSKRHGRVKASIKVVNDGTLKETDLVRIREGIVNGLTANGIEACITIEFTDSKGGLFGTGFMAGWFSDNVYVQSTEGRSRARKNGSKIWLNQNFDDVTSFHEFCHLLGLSDRYHYVANFIHNSRTKDIKADNEGSRNELTQIYDVPMGTKQVDNDPNYNPNNNTMSGGSFTLTPYQTTIIFSQFTRPFGEKRYVQIFAFRQLSRGSVGQLNYIKGKVHAPGEATGNGYVKPKDLKVDKKLTTDDDNPIIDNKVGGNTQGKIIYSETTNNDRQKMVDHLEGNIKK